MSTTNLLFAIYGASGHGRETMPLARAGAAALDGAELVFVDDHPSAQFVNGHRVLTYRQFLEERASRKSVSIAIADSAVRERLADRCRADGLSFFSIVAPNAVIGDDVQFGDGCILSQFTLLTSNVRIGKHFHANMYSYVAHDCLIGDYVTFAPSVRCNGNVSIEDHVYVGTGAVLRQGRPGDPLVVGRGAIVGMGAVVTKSVPPGDTVVGNPARSIIKS